jgi:hypothetical protein
MDTTINNDMFNSLLDRVERLANPLNASTATVPVPAKATLSTELKDKLRAIKRYLGSNTGAVQEPDSWCVIFGATPADNITFTEYQIILSALGIE